MTLVYRLLQWAVSVRFCRINAPSEIQGKFTDRLSASYFPHTKLIFGELFTDLLDSTQRHEHVSKTMCNAYLNGVDASLPHRVCPFCSSSLLLPSLRSHHPPSIEACAVSCMPGCISTQITQNQQALHSPQSLITNPCFLFFVFFILTTKLYKARWQLTPFNKISLIWFRSRTAKEEPADCSAGGHCQPCHQAVGSVEAALLTGRTAESRGLALVRQSPPSEVFFSPLKSTGRNLRSYVRQWTSAC